jgi:hypothetical protein
MLVILKVKIVVTKIKSTETGSKILVFSFLKIFCMKLFVSKSPTTKKHVRDINWYKSIKNTSGIGGKIICNVFGETKEAAELMANKIVEAFNTVNQE